MFETPEPRHLEDQTPKNVVIAEVEPVVLSPIVEEPQTDVVPHAVIEKKEPVSLDLTEGAADIELDDEDNDVETGEYCTADGTCT